MAVLSDDMGGITAYAAAVNRGYTGTKEEFEQLMYSYTEVAERAEAAAGNAHESEEASIEAKDIAVGAKNEAVSARDAAVSARDSSISAKNDSELARDASISAKNDTLAAKDAVMSAKGSVDETSANFSDAVTAAISDVNAAGRNQKELAKTHAIDSEAWAVGQREGADVGVSDETYHNNSKYYAEQSALAKSETETARDAAITAKDNAVAAKNEAETAKGQAQDIVDGINAKSEQIDQNAEDISALQTAVSTKAEIDGNYENLTAGTAEQLASTVFIEDNAPYHFRTSGGSADIGDREYDQIVGGSLAVNQLAKALVEGNYNKGSGTAVYDNGTVSFTAGAKYGALYCATIKELVEYHKYLISAKIKMTSQPSANTVRLGVGNTGYNQGAIYVPPTASVTSFTEISGVVQYSYGTNPTNNYLFLQDNRAVPSQIDMKDLMLIDLTQMFGTTIIADYVYTLETATAGAGVAWLKAHFPKIFDSGYIPYNAGTLEHVSGLSAHKMTGFNQWDEEWEVGAYTSVTGSKVAVNDRIRCKNLIPVLPNTSYYFKAPYTNVQMYYYDANGEYLRWATPLVNRVITIPTDTYFIAFNGPANSGTTYNHDICINLHWDGERDGEYEPYEEHSYPLDSDVTLRGIPKLDASNHLYYDGDTYESDGTVTRRYGIVDLGTLGNWIEYNGWPGLFYLNTTPSGAKIPSSNTIVPNCIAPGYLPCGSNIVGTTGYTKGYVALASNRIYVSNDTYTGDADSFNTAISGVYLVYELATPTTEEGTPYTEIQNVSNWGTEEFVTTSLVPVGHETAYQPDLRAKVEVAPESPDTDGYYLMKRENGENAYVAYLGELPSDPTTDGTYTLKCTVTSGTATKTWEADE